MTEGTPIPRKNLNMLFLLRLFIALLLNVKSKSGIAISIAVGLTQHANAMVRPAKKYRFFICGTSKT